jgi:DNA recombination protein RmuC
MEIVLGIGIAVGLGVVVWVLVQWLKSMQNTVAGSTSEVSRRLNDLNRQIGEIAELGRGMRSLQEFLQSPKLRGNIGEQVLKDMIGQTFPKNSFHLQYPFKSGVKVDAVLKTDAGLLCIDSKFPMENFTLMHKGETEAIRVSAKRDFIADVKKHIMDISRKYILPEEGTMDFALMYIPSESVYYEIATIEELMDFSRRNRVYPVSPNTLYAHLQVLLLSFQGKELEQKSREVFRLLRAIQKDYEKTGEQLGVLGRHIGNAYNTMSGVSGSFDVLGQKLSKTQRFTGRDEKQLEE